MKVYVLTGFFNFALVFAIYPVRETSTDTIQNFFLETFWPKLFGIIVLHMPYSTTLRFEFREKNGNSAERTHFILQNLLRNGREVWRVGWI